jgi:hypothetical protein
VKIRIVALCGAELAARHDDGAGFGRGWNTPLFALRFNDLDVLKENMPVFLRNLL